MYLFEHFLKMNDVINQSPNIFLSKAQTYHYYCNYLLFIIIIIIIIWSIIVHIKIIISIIVL